MKIFLFLSLVLILLETPHCARVQTSDKQTDSVAADPAPMIMAQVSITLTRSNVVPGVTETFTMNDDRVILKLRQATPSSEDVVVEKARCSQEIKMAMMAAVTESGMLDSSFTPTLSPASSTLTTFSVRIAQRINEISWPGIAPGVEIPKSVKDLYLLYMQVLKKAGVE